MAADAAYDSNQIAQREYELKVKEHQLTTYGLIGTVIALVFAFVQYRKADQWKRAEFLAKEMKDFFDDPDVKNVVLMIDWASRRVNLLQIDDKNPNQYPMVTRKLQVSALRPHTLLTSDGGSDSQGDNKSEYSASVDWMSKFSTEEAKIRDSYDRFLDYLERFASYLQSKLVSVRELDPYLRYWIEDIASYTENPDDAVWTCALMTYIEFYGFSKVQDLFQRYGHNISRSGELFAKQLKVMTDQELAKKLRDAHWR